MMIAISEILVQPNYSAFYVISWTIVSTTESMNDYFFSIYTAPAASTPLAERLLLDTGITDFDFVYDIPYSLNSAVKEYFSIDITKVSTGVTVNASGGYVSVYMVPVDNVAEAIIYQEEYFLDNILIRNDVKLLTKRRTGTRCSACYDEITGEITKSNCSVCYRTGYVGGYSVAKPINISFTEPGFIQKFDVQEVRDVQNQITYGWTKNYPLILPGDVIVDEFNRRFRIINSQPTTKDGRIYLRQSISMQLIPPTDPVYKLVVV